MKTNWKTLGCGRGGRSGPGRWSPVAAAAEQGAVAVQEQAKKVVVIPPLQSNVVANWNQIATKTINATGFPAVTDEERRPGISIDLATVQLAVYDAVMAIVRTHKPYAAQPRTSGAGASQQAAVASATYNVLKALFPNRSPTTSRRTTTSSPRCRLGTRATAAWRSARRSRADRRAARQRRPLDAGHLRARHLPESSAVVNPVDQTIRSSARSPS